MTNSFKTNWLEWLRRPMFWEIVTAVGVGIGLCMLMQPFSKWAYRHGFVVLLVMTAAYVIISHFPQRGSRHGRD